MQKFGSLIPYGPGGLVVRLQTIERLTTESGEPSAPCRWSLLPGAGAHLAVNVHLDDEIDDIPAVRMWVFDSAKPSPDNAQHVEIKSDADLDDLVSQIRAAITGE